MSVVTTFDNEWDNMPEGRQKYAHGVSAVCKFTLDIQDSPYTGLFKNGVQTGIIRIGSALDIGGGSEYGAGLFPGAGIKFLRTGKTSGNIVMSSLAMKTSYNFFDPDHYPLYNHLSSPTNDQYLANKLIQASECQTKVSLSDITR